MAYRTPEQQRLALDALEETGQHIDAAAAAGVSLSTYNRWRRASAEAQKAAELRAAAEDVPLSTIAFDQFDQFARDARARNRRAQLQEVDDLLVKALDKATADFKTAWNILKWKLERQHPEAYSPTHRVDASVTLNRTGAGHTIGDDGELDAASAAAHYHRITQGLADEGPDE